MKAPTAVTVAATAPASGRPHASPNASTRDAAAGSTIRPSHFSAS